ncbi:hypothetical protein MNBD_GAMMA15-208, partial [hydrothermal vent metagenome]
MNINTQNRCNKTRFYNDELKSLNTPSVKMATLCCLCLVSLCSAPILLAPAQAGTTGFLGTPLYKTGYVSARALVKGSNGQNIYAEIDDAGNVIREIGEAVGQYAQAQIISGDTYRGYFSRFEQLQTETPGSGLSADNKTLLNALGQAILVTPINLANRDAASDAVEIKSVLISESGDVLSRSKNRIAFRIAMFGLEDGTDAGPGNDRDIIRRPGDTLLGPMSGTPVQFDLGRQYATVVGSDGAYYLQAGLPPCPGFVFTYTSSINIELKYLNFNPRRNLPVQSWYLTRPTRDTCTGLGAGVSRGIGLTGGLNQLNAVQADNLLLSGSSNVDFRQNFVIDMVVLSGTDNRLANLDGQPIPQGALTAYALNPIDYTALDQTANLDLDGDGLTDNQAAIKDAQGNTTEIAVYLNGRAVERDPSTGQPINEDLRRQPDQQAQQVGNAPPSQMHQGLLTQISETDLLDTDILTLRESNGEIVSERNKLQGNRLRSVETSRNFGAGITEDGSLYFTTPVIWTQLSSYDGDRVFVPPSRAQREYIEKGADGRAEIRNADIFDDFLRPGEIIRTYMINRATGYIGYSRAQINSNAGQFLLGTRSPPSQLLPPNLKIKVERRHNVVAGITQGETRNNLVGFEGSGLTSDTLMVITTQWYNHDGSPLPDKLPGYTARLAKVVSNKQLAEIGSGGGFESSGNIVSRFEIAPGTHTKTIYLPEDNRPDHFYIHVSGQPMERPADFSVSGVEGILGERPAKYVPFKVAVFDEEQTRIQKNAARAAGEDVNEVKPVYNWVYRPEMSFSVFD